MARAGQAIDLFAGVTPGGLEQVAERAAIVAVTAVAAASAPERMRDNEAC